MESILKMSSNFKSDRLLKSRGFSNELFDNAVRLYVYSVLTELSNNVERPCAKDPYIVKQMEHISRLFPKARFIYMVRDPRAQIISLMKFHNTQPTLEHKKKYLQDWNVFNLHVNNQCVAVGMQKCMLVHYEELILDFNSTMSRVVEFLNITWTDNFLHHEDFVGGKIKTSSVEWSTQQIKKPLYAKSLSSWTNFTTYNDIGNETENSITMFKVFGYDWRKTTYEYLVKAKNFK